MPALGDHQGGPYEMFPYLNGIGLAGRLRRKAEESLKTAFGAGLKLNAAFRKFAHVFSHPLTRRSAPPSPRLRGEGLGMRVC